MVDGRKQAPFRAAVVDRVVVDRFESGPLARDLAELHASSDGDVCQLIDREAVVQQADLRFLDQRHAAKVPFLDLNESCHRIFVLLNDYSIISIRLFNYFELLEPGFVDSQSETWSVVIEIDKAVLRLGFTLKDVPEQFVAHFDIDNGKIFRHRCNRERQRSEEGPRLLLPPSRH
jgi:hypothetical protein